MPVKGQSGAGGGPARAALPSPPTPSSWAGEAGRAPGPSVTSGKLLNPLASVLVRLGTRWHGCRFVVRRRCDHPGACDGNTGTACSSPSTAPAPGVPIGGLFPSPCASRDGRPSWETSGFLTGLWARSPAIWGAAKWIEPPVSTEELPSALLGFEGLSQLVRGGGGRKEGGRGDRGTRPGAGSGALAAAGSGGHG